MPVFATLLLRLLRHFDGAAFLFMILPVLPLAAQNAANRNVVVGKLTGEDDYRLLTITTSEGTFPVRASGNDRPFEVVESSEQRLFIHFKLPAIASRTSSPSIFSVRPTGVEYRYFPTERSLVTAIILDEVDYAVLLGESSAEEIVKATNNYRILPVKPPPNTVDLICYNFERPLLRERALRHALSYAINREKIRRQFFLSKADLARGPFENESAFYPAGLKELGYDPKTAIALLEEAGWSATDRDRIRSRSGQPLRFRLLFQEGVSLKEQMVRQIKIDWNQIGIDVVPIPVSAAALNDSLQRGRFDAVLLRHRFVESAQSLIEFFGDGAGAGAFSYVNPRYRHPAALSRNFTRIEELRPIVMRMQVMLNEDQAATFLFHPWLTIHVINAAKFEDFLGNNGLPKPFNEWVIRGQ